MIDVWGLTQILSDYASRCIDIVLPPRARTIRTQSRDFSAIPLTTRSHALLGTQIVTLMNYQDGAVQDLIRSLKYDGSRHAAHICATLLADYLREEIASVRAFSPRPCLLIPLPLHSSRERERGFNQIQIILDRLGAEFHDGTFTKITAESFIRAQKTKQQTHLTRAARIKNVAKAFEVVDKGQLKNMHVFLIDDVTTTGATLASAGRTLEQSGATVTLIALARA